MKIIETKRLLLKEWQRRDAARLYEYAKNPAVGWDAGWQPHESPAMSRRIITKVFIPRGTRKIVRKKDGLAIGSIGLLPDDRRPGINSRELGYSLAQDCWGNGYMTEAAFAMLEYGFRVAKADIISITIGTENLRCQHVIDKLHFVKEGLQRKAYLMYDGSFRDLLCYSLTKEEWESHRWRQETGGYIKEYRAIW